jgi:protein-S-isoprenylcysteine O-methyltransferase Ste14
LAILNATVWFRNPFSAAQVFSWISLIASAFLAVHGFTLLRKIGRPQGNFEATTRLVTSGAYRYIRHPLYASLLLLGLGTMLKQVTLLTALLGAVCTAALYATAKVEEAENLQRFGDDYAAYMRRTRMFIPFVF